MIYSMQESSHQSDSLRQSLNIRQTLNENMKT